MQTVIHIALVAGYLVLFSYFIQRSIFFVIPGIHKKWIHGAFYLKIVAGFTLAAIYTWHYTLRDTSDSYRYFDDAMVIRDLLFTNPKLFFQFLVGYDLNGIGAKEVFDQLHCWTTKHRYGLPHDGPTIVRINVLISIFSLGYYHVHTIFMCMMSMIGFTAICKSFVQIFKGREVLLFMACFCLPSVVFWSSGILKEAPLFMVFGLFIYNALKIYAGSGSWKQWLALLFCVWVMLNLKVYVLFTLVPAMLFLVLIKLVGEKYLWIKFISVHVVCMILAFNAHYFFEGGDFLYVLNKKQIDFYNVARDFDAKSTISIPEISDAVSFIMHYPQAMFLTLFRPHVAEIKSAFYAGLAIENMVYLLLLTLGIVKFTKPKREHWPMLLALLSYTLILGGIIGSTVPILGAVVRYRIMVLPFFVILIFSVIPPVFFSGKGVVKPQDD